MSQTWNKASIKPDIDLELEKNPNQNIPKQVNLVFNYSSIQLTEAMDKLLNRGLNFSILPLKLDITQILVDYRKFERSVIWHEFWFARETQNEFQKSVFKKHKTNMPKNYTTPQGLQIYLNAIKSDLLDPRNRNTASCNIPEEEIQALKALIKLQRDRVIKIMACDKGAGIIILDFNEYMRACYTHLSSEQIQNDGTSNPYYIKINEFQIGKAKQNIKYIIEEGLHHGYISQEEYNEMNPEDRDFGRFYLNFKVHKEHTPMFAPPPRPIVSVSGSFAENIGVFVEHHIKDLVWKHSDILEDTPDFLRTLETDINQGLKLSSNSILASIDVQALFTNIPGEESLKCLTESLDERINPQIPTGFITRLMEAILDNNLFMFNKEYFKQNIGASMGQRPIPSLANIFMARRIDSQIRSLAAKFNKLDSNTPALRLLKRFLDDLFLIFEGTTKEIHKLFDEINQIHPSIKFTMTHTSVDTESNEDKCKCPQQDRIPFLDTSCRIKDNKIDIDLHKKKTDRNRYLLPSSCHPRQTTRSIPFSLALRIVRICTHPDTREMRFKDLKSLLLARSYQEQLIDRAINKARSIPRNVALRKVKKKKTSDRPVFVMKFDPRLPNISNIQSRHWRAMVSQDQYLKDCFKTPPLIAYKKQRNIREHLIRAKVPENSRHEKRQLNGMFKCGNQCTACPYISEGKSVKHKDSTWNINRSLNCNSYNIIYLIECKKERCRRSENYRYVGETKRPLKYCLADHRGYILNQKDNQATGAHFNLPGHSLSDLSVTILERVNQRDETYRKEREKYHIRRLNTFHSGLNKKV